MQASNVEHAIAREKSIVVPVLPENVADELKRKLSMKLNGEAEPSKPGKVDTSALEAQMGIRPTPQPQPNVVPAATTTDTLKAKLIAVIVKLVQQRSQEVDKESVTMTELSIHVNTVSHKSWGGHWSKSYGPLVDFVKAIPSLQIVRNKYVILLGRSVVGPKTPAPTPAPVQKPKPKQPINLGMSNTPMAPMQPMNANYNYLMPRPAPNPFQQQQYMMSPLMQTPALMNSIHSPRSSSRVLQILLDLIVETMIGTYRETKMMTGGFHQR